MDITSYLLGKKAGGGEPPVYQNKEIEITENGETTITSDIGYDALQSVSITTNVPTGIEAPEKDVNFYDYDGKRLYSYTKNEFLALESMPDNPTRDGLIAQGWNWNLVDAKNFITDYDFLDIGQMYRTDDGATRIYITLDDYAKSPYLTLNFYGTLEVNWGDGTTSNFTSTNNNTLSQILHEYSSAGDYVISIKPLNSTIFNLTYNNYNCSTILRPNVNTGGYGTDNDRLYISKITKIEVGNNCNITKGSFNRCVNLECLLIPNTITYSAQSFIMDTYKLKYITIPNTITQYNDTQWFGGSFLEKISLPNNIQTTSMYSPQGLFSSSFHIKKIAALGNSTAIPTSCYDQCYILEKVILPKNLTSIGESAFRINYSLTHIKFPSTLTTIGSNAFAYCYAMQIYDFTELTSVPTISNNTFQNIPSYTKIIVPDELYDEWVETTNWTGYANRIVKASEA